MICELLRSLNRGMVPTMSFRILILRVWANWNLLGVRNPVGKIIEYAVYSRNILTKSQLKNTCKP